MSSAVLTQGLGTFGGVGCIPTLGFACASRSSEIFTSVTSGSPKNNRVTVSTGGGFSHKNVGKNTFMSSDATAAELGDKFDDPRYYGKEL